MSVLADLSKETGVAENILLAQFRRGQLTGEVRDLEAKMAVVRAERDKVAETYKVQLQELQDLLDEAKKRADEELGKG